MGARRARRAVADRAQRSTWISRADADPVGILCPACVVFALTGRDCGANRPPEG
jgi:hypothetical protein